MTTETRTIEPPDQTILASPDLVEVYRRNDAHAALNWYGDAHWYTPNLQVSPVTWDDVPEDVRNGVRLVVAQPAEVSQ